MRNILASIVMSISCCIALADEVLPPLQTSGAVVVVPAFGEVRHPNDQARATFMIEEQDKDMAAAASRVNLKTRQGLDILKREDMHASLKTRGYYTYPVYAADEVPARQSGRIRQPIGWRVGQYVEMTTSSLDALPQTVAAVQRVLALNGLYFGLTDATSRKLEEQRIAAAYKNLSERVTAIAKAMGRNPADAVLDTVDFEGTGAYAPAHEVVAAKAMRASSGELPAVEIPSFEPGETTLNMRVVGKVKFK